MSEKPGIGSAGGRGTNLKIVMATLEIIKMCVLPSCGSLPRVTDAVFDIIGSTSIALQ